MASPRADFPEWSRRDERVRQVGRAMAQQVEGRRPALEALFAELGVREAFLFGSVARGEARPGSDVDIAVAGCPSADFYRLASKLERALDLPLDLVDLDAAPAEFAEPIRSHGQRLYPAPKARSGRA